MILHNDPLLSIYFGDARTGLEREFLMSDCGQDELMKSCHMSQIKKLMRLESLVLLRQTHSAFGFNISEDTLPGLLALKQEGDFLITDCLRTGMGVYTADCLPIIIYDSYNHALGICHAGWMGSIDQIALKALDLMRQQYETELDHIRIFFGPSAKACCYEVTSEFVDKLTSFEFFEQVLSTHADKLYFDLPLFNRLLLEEYGVQKNAFHMSYNVCTICNDCYCSSRRDKGSMQRQLTVVALK